MNVFLAYTLGERSIVNAGVPREAVISKIYKNAILTNLPSVSEEVFLTLFLNIVQPIQCSRATQGRWLLNKG